MHAGKKMKDTLNLVTKRLVVGTIARSKKDSTPSIREWRMGLTKIHKPLEEQGKKKITSDRLECCSCSQN
jgi:hypothetical protein